MSLAECRLVLAEDANLQAANLLAETQSRRLVAGAKWSGKIAKELDHFLESLRDIVDPEAKKAAAPATRSNVTKFFSFFGIKPTKA